MFMKEVSVLVLSFKKKSNEDPCIDCDSHCNGYDMQFCCTRCSYDHHGDPPCDICIDQTEDNFDDI